MEYPKAANWRKFDSFGWHSKPDDADDCCIYHTNHRDSTLLDNSNAKHIKTILGDEKFEDDVSIESFGHWAVGWIEAVIIRVQRNGKNTPAYTELCKIIDRLNNYPVLDETDYYESEFNATLDNIVNAATFDCQTVNVEVLPEGWQSEVYSWLGDNGHDSELESCDDNGGYPSSDPLTEYIKNLYPQAISS